MVGTTLGSYRVLEKLGEGGMGVVYKARDTRLGRDVAIKVLPPAFARDPDRLTRFEREARAVAAINHPNILSVHDIGSADVADPGLGTARVTYMITELLDGETLRDRLAQGPIPARKSVDIAMQVARGLAAAHDRGIVHRDLKPENVVVLRDGHVKILDFGLAKQMETAAGSHDQQTVAATDAGTVLGTVGYMAPEQVRSESVDRRTDLFALGVVLHEMLTGRRVFQRATAAETMTAILRDETPDLTGPPSNLPAGLARIVHHALEKSPADRFQSARDFAFALQGFADASTSGPTAAGVPRAGVTRPMRAREVAAWTLAGVLAASAAAAWWWPHTAAAPGASPLVFTPALPWMDGPVITPSLSPDGKQIAFVTPTPAGDVIVLRDLAQLQSQTLKGTAGARRGNVFWSPDGRSLGFFAGGRLKTIELGTGKIDEIAPAPSAYGGAWGPDGTILFSPDERTPVFRVHARGGVATPVTTLDPDRQDQAHRWPQFMPDGRSFVFMPWAVGPSTRSIQLASLDGAAPKRLFDSATGAIVAGNYLIYAEDVPTRLVARRFDPATLAVDDRAVPVVPDDNVDFAWASGAPLVSASANVLIYTTGKTRRGQLTWFSRSGRALGTIGEPGDYYDPAISPDGSTLAVERWDTLRGSTDLWTVDLGRPAFSRLTSGPGFENGATWLPDGRRLTYSSDQRDGRLKVLVRNADGTGPESVLFEGRAFPTDWSKDGKLMLFTTPGGSTLLDVVMYNAEQKTALPLMPWAFNESLAKFSPDEKWVAYVSDETGESQVYIRSLPDLSTKIPISTGGGSQPSWRREGGELFYLAPDGMLMSVRLRTANAKLTVSPPEPLFQTNTEAARFLRNTYVAAADGEKFLVISPLVHPSTSPLVGVLNWSSGLSRTP